MQLSAAVRYRLRFRLRAVSVPLRFYFKPRWLVGHVIIVAMVILMVNLGLWQLRRLHEQQDLNATIRAAQSAPTSEVHDLPLSSALTEYHHITLTGTWAAEQTVFVRYPIVDGRPGYYVVTPLVLANGERMLVNRGWIPVDEGKNASSSPATSALATSAKPVVVEGLVRNTEPDTASVNRTNGSPPISTFKSVDVERMGDVIGVPLTDAHWVQLSGVRLAEESPGTDPGAEPGIKAGTKPRPLDPPELTEGSHFSYTLQWFSFSAIAVIGWGVLLVRAGRDSERENENDNENQSEVARSETS